MSKSLKTIGTIAGIVAGVALIATGVGAAFGATILVAGMTTSTIATVAGVISGVAGLLAQKLAKPPPVQGSVSQVIIDTDPPQPYVMGEGYVGGIRRYDVGYGGFVAEVHNPYRWMIDVYSGGGPVESITPYIDFAAAGGYLSGYLATDTQLGECPESSALAVSFGGTPSGWGSAYKLSGQAAIGWNLKFDKTGKVFASGVPVLGAYGQWVKVYDPRLDSTFPGGSGSHRVDDETTWEYSDNPALHAGTYAYGRYQNGKQTFGIGLPTEGIDWETVAAWANVCDTNSWTIFGRVFEPGDRWANLKDICMAGGAEPIFANAVLSFRFAAPVISLDTVTEEDISEEMMSVTSMQSYRDRVNTLIPKYISAAHNWEMVAAEAISVAEYVTDDGEERKEEWAFNLVKNVDQATQLAAYRLVDAREIHPIVITCKPRMRAYRPGDCLTLDLPQLGLDMDAVILSRSFNPANMTVTFVLISETPEKHAFALGLSGVEPETPALGQDQEDRDDTSDSFYKTPAVTVADATALAALEGSAGRIAKRTDTGESYSHNGGTSGTIADWELIGTTVLSDDLAALEALSGTGLAARTGTSTWATRTLTGTANEVTVTNGDGVAGNPTVSLPATLTLTGKTVTFLDTGFTVQDNLDPTKQVVFQVSGVTTGTTRTLTIPNGSGIIAVSAAAPISLGATGALTWNGGDLTRVNDTNVTITIGGTPANSLANNVSLTVGWSGTLDVSRGGTGGGSASGTLLDNITGFASTALIARTAAGTYAFRTITGTGNEITVTNGSGVSGNPTLSLPSALTFTGKTVTGGTFSSLEGLSVTVASNKTFSAQNITSSAITDFSTGGVGLGFSRPTDGVTNLAGAYCYQSSGGTTNFVLAARGDLVLATGGGGVATAALERMRINTSGNGSFFGRFTVTGTIGFETGAGGTVAQATSKATAVTLNKPTGQITMDAAALAANTVVSFTLNNSEIASTDLIEVTHHSAGTVGEYLVNGRATGAGTASISVKNTSAGSLSEAIVLKFAVIKAVTS